MRTGLLIPLGCLFLATAACSSTPSNDAPGNTNSATCPAASSGNASVPPSVDGGAANVAALPFTPSNIPSVDLGGVGDMDVRPLVENECSLDTDTGKTTCDVSAGTPFRYFKVAQGNGGGNVGVFVVHRLAVGPSVGLSFRGSLPAVLIAIDSVQVSGQLRASATITVGAAGGFSDIGNGVGGGNGGGIVGSFDRGTAGGGGSYCGAGGSGAMTTAPQAGPGATYGNEALVPLVGGSSGGGDGNGSTPGGGAGGGALQVVAGASITVDEGGAITSGGGGANGGGGGGSGGALLLEAPVVTVAGKLAVNGGGGAAMVGSEKGQNGQSSDTPALGGAPISGGGATGGSGSGGMSITGADGTGTGQAAGGGGGGAGRIRINTKSGNATISGLVSPSLGTPCVSQGTVK